MRGRHLTGIVALALVASAPIPATAGAVTLGSRSLGIQPELGATCDAADVQCIWVNTRIPGAEVRAPFSGRIRKWRVVTPGINVYQLVVMRKQANGKFKAVETSDVEETDGAGTHGFETNVRIKKGDYIGIRGEVFQGFDYARARAARFGPPIAPIGESVEPALRSSREFLYNATLKR
jgi:hypothetical protein